MKHLVTTTLLVTTLTFNFLFAEDDDCVQFGLTLGHASDGEKYIPKRCQRRDCAVKASDGISLQGLQCRIDHNCKNTKQAVSFQSLPESGKQLDQACQAKLLSIGLFTFYCKEIEKHEESLSITFGLPTSCGKMLASTSYAVMVDFIANRGSQSFFVENPSCRIANFSGSNFNHLSDSDLIEISDQCMAIGLEQTGTFYLSLTTFPSGAHLNYSMVYIDSDRYSMRLLAAAWHSTTSVHVIFLPVSEVTKYLVWAESEGKKVYDRQVDTSPVEITGIPFEYNVIMIKVMPLHGATKSSSAQVTTIDKTLLYFSTKKKRDPSKAREVVLIVGVLLIVVLVVAIVLVLYRRCRKPPGQHKQERLHMVLCLPGKFQTKCSLRKNLRRRGFQVTDCFPGETSYETKMRDYNTLLIFMHQSVQQSPDLLQPLRAIFENEPLWTKVKIASFPEKGQRHLKPSDIFENSFKFNLNNSLEQKFFARLDENNFYMPEDMDRLIKSLNCEFGGERPLLKTIGSCDSLSNHDGDTSSLTSETDQGETRV